MVETTPAEPERPKPVQALWIGEQMGTMQRLSIASFLAHGHPIYLYTYRNVSGVPDGVEIFDANSVLDESEIFMHQEGREKGSLGAFSDLFRYKILLERGGWWVDLDVVALRPFQTNREYVFGFEDAKLIGTAVIHVPAGSELIAQCYERARAAGKNITWSEIGPHLFTRTIRELGLVACAAPPVVFYPIPWQKCGLLTQPGGFLSRRSVGVHLWHQVWQWGPKDPEGVFPSDCIYEKLKRRYLNRDLK